MWEEGGILTRAESGARRGGAPLFLFCCVRYHTLLTSPPLPPTYLFTILIPCNAASADAKALIEAVCSCPGEQTLRSWDLMEADMESSIEDMLIKLKRPEKSKAAAAAAAGAKGGGGGGATDDANEGFSLTCEDFQYGTGAARVIREKQWDFLLKHFDLDGDKSISAEEILQYFSMCALRTTKDIPHMVNFGSTVLEWKKAYSAAFDKAANTFMNQLGEIGK